MPPLVECVSAMRSGSLLSGLGEGRARCLADALELGVARGADAAARLDVVDARAHRVCRARRQRAPRAGVEVDGIARRRHAGAHDFEGVEHETACYGDSGDGVSETAAAAPPARRSRRRIYVIVAIVVLAIAAGGLGVPPLRADHLERPPARPLRALRLHRHLRAGDARDGGPAACRARRRCCSRAWPPPPAASIPGSRSPSARSPRSSATTSATRSGATAAAGSSCAWPTSAASRARWRGASSSSPRHGGKTVFMARWLFGLRIFGAWIAGHGAHALARVLPLERGGRHHVVRLDHRPRLLLRALAARDREGARRGRRDRRRQRGRASAS